jgi:hypothetical protein
VTPAGAAPAGPGPDLPDEGDDFAHLRALIEVEPIVPTAVEANDAFAALAALLLDAQAARRNRGDSPTPSSENLRPDARCHEARPVAPPAGGEAA